MSNKYLLLMNESEKAELKAIQKKDDKVMSKFWKDMSNFYKEKALNLTIEEALK